MLKKFLQEFFKEKKIHLAGGLLLIAGAFTLLAAGAVSESTVALLRTLMNRSVTGEITDYYLRKLNFLVYTVLFCGIFITSWSCISLFVPSLKEKIIQWYKSEGFTEKSGTFLLFSFWMGIFFRTESYLCSHFWNDTLALICSISSTTWSNLITQTLPEMQSAPPGVLVFIKLVGEICGYREQLLTFPVFIAGILSLFVFYKLLKELFSPQVRAVIFFLFACNASAIFYAGELKQYGFDLFFCILLLYHTVRLLKDDSLKVMPGALLSGIAAVLFSHASLLFIPAFGAVLFFQRVCKNRAALLGVILLNIFWGSAVLAAGLLALKTMPRGMYIYHAPFFAPLPFNAAGIQWYKSLIQNIFAFPCSLSLNFLLTGAAAAAITVMGMYCLVRKNIWYFCCCTIPLIFLLGASFCKKYPIDSANNAVTARLILFIIPFITLFAAAALEHLLHCKKSLFKIFSIWFAAMAVSVLFFSFPIYWNVEPLCQKLKQSHKSGEIVFVSEGARLALSVYLSEEKNFQSVYYRKKDKKNTDKDNFALDFPRKGSFWIFLCHSKSADSLEKYLKKTYRVSSTSRSGGTLMYVAPPPEDINK